MNKDEIKSCIKQNNLNFATLEITPNKICPSNPTLLNLLYVIALETISAQILSGIPLNTLHQAINSSQIYNADKESLNLSKKLDE